MPYDYAATFRLTGRPGHVVEDVITVAPDGAFVAVAIGYGLDENRTWPVQLFETPTDTTLVPGTLTLGEIPVSTLMDGVRVSPSQEPLFFDMEPNGPVARRRGFSSQRVSQSGANLLLERVRPKGDIAFLFSMVDSATGRELQDEPLHSLAALGRSDGARPFRAFAQPLSFLPRSTIRLQIIETTEGVTGTLYIVLVGYTILTGSACPEDVAGRLAQPFGPGLQVPGSASEPMIPFDYVTKFKLTGRPRNVLADEITVNAEGGFVATSIGYGLAVAEQGVAVASDSEAVALDGLALNQLPMDAVAEGFRIRPEYLRLVLGPGGTLASVPRQIAREAFERLNRPEDVSFLYSIHDSGVGRDWQNQPVHNLAGLGIANGQRPFKKFARPRVLGPRSTLRVTIEERFGRGMLFLVLQGYKILAGGRR